jgi:cytochrome c oxidase subunit IV
MATDTHTDTTHDVAHGAHAHDDAEHWSDRKYINLALLLALVTAVEVVLSYIKDDIGAIFLPALLGLMIFKFFAVVLFFMHLRFDNRLFGRLFYTGLGLAVGVYVAALCTFQFFGS